MGFYAFQYLHIFLDCLLQEFINWSLDIHIIHKYNENIRSSIRSFLVLQEIDGEVLKT